MAAYTRRPPAKWVNVEAGPVARTMFAESTNRWRDDAAERDHRDVAGAKLLARGFVDRTRGVIHEHVETAVTRHDRLDERVRRRRLGDIAGRNAAPSPMSAATAAPRSFDRPLMTTRRPSATSRRAISTPIPDVAPVTSATRRSWPMPLLPERERALGNAGRRRWQVGERLGDSVVHDSASTGVDPKGQCWIHRRRLVGTELCDAANIRES